MSTRKKATSNPLGSLFGGGRKRKGNLEDLIHQFIIQDPNVSAMKLDSKPKNELKKAKKSSKDKETPPSKVSTRSTRRNSEEIETEELAKPKDRETPSKISSQTTRKSSGDIEADDGPMFPDSPDEWSPEKPTKKRASRAKKDTSTTDKKTAKSRASMKSPGQPKKSRWDKYKNRDKNTPNAGGSVIRSAVMAEGDMEEEGMEGFLFDDNQPEDSYHENRLPYWLQEEHIKDDKGRGPNDEDYNPTTLSIPEIEYDKLTSIQKKFWQFKSKYFDKVVAFKMWTCYFFYGNDALLVHRLWDTRLGYYQGKIYSYCHEKSLLQMAPKLLDAGYQLVIIKQTDEYPKNKDAEKARDIFQVLTRGTYTENPGLTYNSQFCLCLYEHDDNVGLAYFDTTTYEFYVGEFKDDENKNNLRTILTKTKPAEVIYYKKYLSEETKNLLKTLPSKPVLSVQYLEDEQFKTLSSVVDDISEMFSPSDESKPPMPDFLTSMKNAVMIELKYQIKSQKKPEEEGKEAEKVNDKEISHYFALKALNMCLNFLKELMLADNVFSMGTFHPYDLALEKKSTLYLDSQALQNLEVLEVEYGSTINESRSLFGYMDKTVSGYGKRMFKKWLISPLIDADAINQRLEAVEDLRNNPVITDFYQNGIKELQDLERLLAKIYSLPNKKRISGLRFEEFVKNKLMDFLNILEQLEKVENIISRFEPYIPNFKNARLKQLVTFRDLQNDDQVLKKRINTRSKQKDQPVPGLFPKVGPILEELKGMVYVKEGLLVPAPGLNLEIDEILANIDRIKEKFQLILEKQRDFFQNRLLKFVHTKQRYELEVSDQVLETVQKPRDYVVTSKRKGFVRYHTPEIEATLQELFGFEMDLQRALVVFMADYFRKFYDKKIYWDQIVACLAELDCLCSLAQFSKSMPSCCKPEILPSGDTPRMELKDMVHPVIASQNPYFVPNDFIMDGKIDTFLITGPNMGGKSTLLRQICLAVIMAQVGSYVPASSFKFTVVDRIFTRIGASDRIVEGKSTFFTELEETYNILMEASRNSLVIIDELGRGTSTYDGVSIAYATLKYLAEYVRCITLFATHYHLLLEEFRLYDNVANYYMASEVDNEKEEIEFKYKFVKGQADKSYGIIIAKMAGIQQDVLDIAKEKSEFMTTEKRNIGFEKSLTDKFNKTIQELEKLEEAQGDSEFEIILHELQHLYH